MSSVVTVTASPVPSDCANVSTDPVGRIRCGITVVEVGHHGIDALTADEPTRSSQCEPMSPTTRSDPPSSGRDASSSRCPWPASPAGSVPVTSRTGPTLPEAHARRRLLAERIEAGDEADGVDEAQIRLRYRGVRTPAPASSPAASRRRRACRRAARRSRARSGVIRRADVDGVDAVVVQHLLEASGTAGANPAAGDALGRGPDDTQHGNPDTGQCFCVHPGHEPGADDGCSYIGHVRNRNLSTLPRRSTTANASATTAMKNADTAPSAGEIAPRRPE